MKKREFLALGSGLLLELCTGVAKGRDTEIPLDRRTSQKWKCVYALDRARAPIAGSSKSLASAIRGGSDLRISTEFRHNEHIDTTSRNAELIREVANFGVTYLLGDKWTAGIMNLRPPIDLPNGFGERPSMSFFLYNEDGNQAIARPYLDCRLSDIKPGPSPFADHSSMPKYHQLDGWDAGTNAPSSNFIYDFDVFRFWVRNDWHEVLSHASDGTVLSGSVERLASDFSQGREIKIGVRDLCLDWEGEPSKGTGHEVFVQTGSNYYYTKSRLFVAASHPIVRVKPAIPLRYQSKGWDFGWLMPRTDGLVARWLVDPYTMKIRQSKERYAIRWFTR